MANNEPGGGESKIDRPKLSACPRTIRARDFHVVLGPNLGGNVLNLFLGFGYHLARFVAHFVDTTNSRSEKWI